MKVLHCLVLHHSRKIFPAVFFIIVAIFLSGCNQKIPEEKFADIYIDLLKKQAVLGNERKMTDSLLADIFKKYNVDKIQYTKTLEYYNEDAERWEAFFLLVQDKLKKMQDTVKTKKM